MKRYHVEDGIPTIEVALFEYMNSDDLKKLGALTKEKLPTRKADLAAVIMRYLGGERLRTVWQCLIDFAATSCPASYFQRSETSPSIERVEFLVRTLRFDVFRLGFRCNREGCARSPNRPISMWSGIAGTGASWSYPAEPGSETPRP